MKKNNYLPVLQMGGNGSLDTVDVVNNTIYGNKSVGLYFDIGLNCGFSFWIILNSSGLSGTPDVLLSQNVSSTLLGSAYPSG